MKNISRTITICFIITIIGLTTGACEKKQQQKQKAPKQETPKQETPKEIPAVSAIEKHQTNLSTADLFKTECTKCHEAKRAEDMHASKENFTAIIKEMIKKGAKINEHQEGEIAEFLATPSRFLLREKCAKCHTLDRIFEAHEKGKLTKDTLKKMQQKEGSNISEEEVDSIYEGLNSYYFVSPQIPVSPGF